MALFGKKKKNEELNSEAAENKESNSVTEEMKIILEAREEETRERQAKAEERLQAQEEAGKKELFMEEQRIILLERMDPLENNLILQLRVLLLTWQLYLSIVFLM